MADAEKDDKEGEIIFYHIIDDKEVWFIRFSQKDGMQFNRKDFYNYLEDDFVKGFIEIMEDNYNIKFIQKDTHD